ncbi:FLUCTUATING-LIGHT-ACCLIMATION protein 1, chloroplastic-like [Bidens hawaiensis]|uniref:FLUCTUATING-LIGHT-ACCLIMATION protein 1, chloroplastic-like n=1 Tax=Bidens hawaiensis TaxID=980011 RepID=UPI00404B5689
MAITHFLLQPNFNTYTNPIQSRTQWSSYSCANNLTLKRNHSPYYYYCIKPSSKYNIKCFITNPKPEEHYSFKKLATETTIVNSTIENVIKALQVSLIAAVLSALMFFYDHRLALAASGGRMGGSSFSSGSSSSSSWSSSSSSSYSSPSSSSSYRSYSSSPSSDTYITQINSPTPMRSGAEVKPVDLNVVMTAVVCVFVFYGFVKWCEGDIDIAKTSVVKLQVGSLGTGRSLQRDLNRIAKVADTSNPKGLHYVLQESILALLRNSNNCISGYSSVDVKWSVAGCEKQFTQLSVEERGKFDEETLVNVNNIKKKSEASQSSNGLPNEYIVVTIIVAARGVPELPLIKSSEQLKEALQKLASISASNIMGAEVLWTPQKEDDSLTEQQMLEDYPWLHPL